MTTFDASGPLAVQARITAIQERFAQFPVSGVASGAGSTSFAQALAKRTPGADGASVVAGVGGDQVVADARRYLGVPYVWGGTDPAKGLDCSGLVQRVYKDLGIDLPRVSQGQARRPGRLRLACRSHRYLHR